MKLEYTGSKYEDLDVVSRISVMNSQLESQFSKWRKEAFYNYKKVAGYIYTQQELDKLAAENRPQFVANLFVPILLRMGGNFKNSLGRVVAMPRTPGDYRIGEIITQLLDWNHYKVNDLNYQMACAFMDALIGRMGWTVHDWAYQDDPMGNVYIKRYDPFRIKFDTSSRQRDMSDCNFIIDSGWYSYEQLMAMYAHIGEELGDELTDKAKLYLGTDYNNGTKISSWAQRMWNAVSSGFGYLGRETGYDGQWNRRSGAGKDKSYFDQGSGLFETVELHERRFVRKYILLDTLTGKEQDITTQVQDEYGKLDREKLQMIRSQYIEPVINYKQIKQIFQTTVIPALNMKIFEGPAVLQKNFKYTRIDCLDFDVDVLDNKSYVDHLTDPILSYNKRRNSMLEYLMRVGLGETWVEDGALGEHEDDFLTNKIGGVKKMKPGGLSKIRRVDPAPMPAAMDRFALEDAELVKNISGIRDNAMGGAENAGESGTVFQSRVIQSDIMQSWVMENAVGQMKAIGENTVELMQRFMSMERMIRVTNDEGQDQWVAINQQALGQIKNDISIGEYDIEISRAPFGTLAKEREYQQVLQLTGALAQIDPAYVSPEVLVLSSPSQFKDKLLEHIRQVDAQKAMMAQQQQMMQQAAMQQQAIQQGGQQQMPQQQGGQLPPAEANTQAVNPEQMLPAQNVANQGQDLLQRQQAEELLRAYNLQQTVQN